MTDKPTSPKEVCAGVGKGWTSIIVKLIDDLWAMGWDGGIYQVKEKFGGLRFYINATPEQYKVIMKAEAESFKTCENCGKKGKTKNIDLHCVTLCDEHYRQENALRVKR